MEEVEFETPSSGPNSVLAKGFRGLFVMDSFLYRAAGSLIAANKSVYWHCFLLLPCRVGKNQWFFFGLNHGLWFLWFIYFYCYFIHISTILCMSFTYSTIFCWFQEGLTNI